MLVLRPKFRTLRHAKTMLFVDNHKSQVVELHHIFNKGVGADKDVYVSRQQSGMDVRTFFFPGRARQQRHIHVHVRQQPAESLEMLCRQDFRRSHQARLKAVVQRNQHAHDRHQRFPATHITLQKAVHLFARRRILADLFDYTFLRVGQFKRQVFPVKRIQVLSHPFKNEAVEFGFPVGSIPDNVELNKKQLLKFQPEFSVTKQYGIPGEMNVFDGIVKRNQVSRFHHIGRK